MLFDVKEYDYRTIACDNYLKEIQNLANKVVVSVSSGKTSTYMALNKNQDDKRPYFYQFAVVLTSDTNAKPKDKGLLRECQKKIPWFEASHEIDDSLKVILELEQELGQEIRWLASEYTFESLIEKKKAVPNNNQRFCTEKLKYEVQFWDTYLYFSDGIEYNDNSFVPNPLSVEVQVGFRWDERQRVYRALGVEKGSSNCDSFKYSYCCDISGEFAGKHRWVKTDWRLRTFPLYLNRVTSQDVYQYWEKRNWDYSFPPISNCVFCFHKSKKELQQQFNLYPERLSNWIEQELKTGHTFKKEVSLKEVILEDVLPESSSFSCFCTD